MTQSTSTIEKYEYLLIKFAQFIDITDPKKSYDSLTEHKLSLSTIKCILSAVVWKIRKTDSKNPHLKEFVNIISSLRKQSEQKERDHKNTHGIIPKWIDILKKRDDELNDGNFKNHLVLSLYTYVPPRRIKDYTLLKIANTLSDATDKEFNYCIISNHILVFNNYKTKKTYGSQFISIPDTLFKIITTYCEANNIKNGDLLLGFKNIFQMNYLLKTLIGCSVDNLRHSYVTHEYEQFNVPSSDFIEKMASHMGHSVETNLRYRKF